MDAAIRKESQAEAFEQFRVLLFSIAYRMTGSASDAEDLVQETYLRYQASADQKIDSLRAYLSTIITRLALDYLKSAHVTREQYIGTWLPEPILTSLDGGVAIEQQEALSLAFMRLLETLSPPERAVFLLHEVFDYPFSEIGGMLEKSPANCRQIFHRARQALQDKRVRFEPEPQRQRQLLLRFLSASQAGDMAGLTNLLAQDAVSWGDGGGKVQANIQPVYGQQAVARVWSLWLDVKREQQLLLATTLAEINGGPAILFWDGDNLAGVLCLTLSAAGIQEIYAMVNPEKLAYLRKQLSSASRQSSPES
ncbi:MAG TPA: RNA polymerase sigma-70 factor [Ktedonobacterales bacterium]|jgi:RNA polymerase sigma-70 factor (ECF subfamily)